MKKRWVILNVILLMLIPGVLTPHSAQDVPLGMDKSDQTGRRHFAVSLLRTINTAEVVDQVKYGAYSSWQTLVAHHSESFDQFTTMYRQQLSDVHFAEPPEILPGWNLRMSLHADGRGYDLLLRDTTDTKCGYAAVTNENAVIWQSKTIDCEI